jgi:hypothetical protein
MKFFVFESGKKVIAPKGNEKNRNLSFMPPRKV